jgi:hypothetical protein
MVVVVIEERINQSTNPNPQLIIHVTPNQVRENIHILTVSSGMIYNQVSMTDSGYGELTEVISKHRDRKVIS